MTDDWEWIIVSAKAVKGTVFASAAIFYSLACDAIDVMNDDDLTTALQLRFRPA